MVLPTPSDAAVWFVETARAELAAGARLEPDAVRLLIVLAPDDPMLTAAIDGVELRDAPQGTAAVARAASARLRDAVALGDEGLARDTVDALEAEVLRGYRPAEGFGRFDDDVAVALAMLDAHDVGADQTHLMMAEELLLGALRRYWGARGRDEVAADCEAAVALTRLAGATGTAAYRDRALEVMHAYASHYRALGTRAAPYVAALQVVGQSA